MDSGNNTLTQPRRGNTSASHQTSTHAGNRQGQKDAQSESIPSSFDSGLGKTRVVDQNGIPYGFVSHLFSVDHTLAPQPSFSPASAQSQVSTQSMAALPPQAPLPLVSSYPAETESLNGLASPFVQRSNSASTVAQPGLARRSHNPFQNMKLSHFFHGIHVSTNFSILMAFLFFLGWLFVVYWVRHNEPFADQVLGTVPQSITSAVDRRLVDGIKQAFPIRLSSDTGAIYEPLPGSQRSTVDLMRNQMNTLPAVPSAQLFGSPAQTQASQAQYGSNGQVQEMEASISPAGTETQQMVAPMVVPATTAQTASVVPPVYPVNATQPSACAVSTVQSSNGPKLKFIVNE
jgi:hypothetical protein